MRKVRLLQNRGRTLYRAHRTQSHTHSRRRCCRWQQRRRLPCHRRRQLQPRKRTVRTRTRSIPLGAAFEVLVRWSRINNRFKPITAKHRQQPPSWSQKKEEASLVTGGDDRINIRCVPHLSLLVRDKKSDHLASALLLLTILPQSLALVYRYPAKRRVAPVKGPKPVFSNLDTFARRVEIAAHVRPSRRRFVPSRAYRLQKLLLAVGYALAPVLVPCPLLDLRLVDMTLAAAVLFLVVLLVDPFHRDPYS